MKKYLLFVLILAGTMLLFSQGATRATWQASSGANYTTNINLAYAYSDQEYSDGAVTSIPGTSSFINIIDFYGEGRIVTGNTVSGFKSAYNINHQYQLVSKGPDAQKKIPNRIPVSAYNGNLNLAKYVTSDKVNNITLMGSSIQQNTAEEIARMIRKDGLGKIIIYGFNGSEPAVVVLEKELAKIGFYHVPKYVLETPFSEIKGFSGTPKVYKNKKIKVVGEKVFYSLNAKTNPSISQEDMATLDYSSLLGLNSDVSGGIKGTIDKEGGKIEIEAFAYDSRETDGIQKLYSTAAVSKDKLVYRAYSDITDVNNYIEKTNKVPYGFVINEAGVAQILAETESNNVKLLGATSKSGWESQCDYAPLRFLKWLQWKWLVNFPGTEPCQKVKTLLTTGRQPVIVKVSIKDATLYDFKIPGMANNMIHFVDTRKNLEEYKIIKKLKVTILESPNDHQNASFYKEKIGTYIKETNTFYAAKTGKTKSAEITAEIGNPRFLFKDVDLIIKKGSKESYNYQVNADNDAFKSEASVDQNNGETMQLIYIHSLARFYPANTTNVRVIRGMSRNGSAVINTSDFTVFSYSRMFNDSPSVYGSPGATLAHEFGHYFNLDHPFEGGCAQNNGGDHVSDTPPAEGSLWYLTDPGGANESGITNPCQNFTSCSGTRRQVENIMDYGPCRWLFTEGQANRMTNRINTKPGLFNTVFTSDDIDPNDINIVVDDQRRGELRRKSTGSDVSRLSVRMIYPDSKYGAYQAEVISDQSEKAKIQVFDHNRTLVYEKDVVVEKGKNYFQIEPRFFEKNGLYILSYTGERETKQVKILSNKQ
ncbi:M43 family zinc metalloprotease [Chryseobacterium herbae]|uniref:M43 family zinc metalloprotease n=1 Tax=Chryseobacterium herbae TaxID=2976476 RepID=A0ABT2IXV6_9FLAO|nr:M43 family zinc metalloprotease [Chryseobacterium sp. pc1-10]MCT2563678.1 M43 family zinc metalloprotease [Chryseobacterium sp. pc1-10]